MRQQEKNLKQEIMQPNLQQFLPPFAESRKRRDEMNCLLSKFRFYSIPLKTCTAEQ
jgi:hypothetical protein